MIINVGIGECALSNNVEDIIVTYALASCVAVTAYSPVKKAAGMVHIVLPSPMTSNMEDYSRYYFAITGVPSIIDNICSRYGCARNELIIKLFGGADSINKADIFRLGQRNICAVEDILKGMGLAFDSTETGGGCSRTIEIDVATGTIAIKMQPIII